MLRQFRNYVVKDAGAAKKKCFAVDANATRPEFTNPLYSDDDCDEVSENEAGADTATGSADEFQSEDVDMAQGKVAFDGRKVEAAKEVPSPEMNGSKGKMNFF